MCRAVISKCRIVLMRAIFVEPRRVVNRVFPCTKHFKGKKYCYYLILTFALLFFWQWRRKTGKSNSPVETFGHTPSPSANRKLSSDLSTCVQYVPRILFYVWPSCARKRIFFWNDYITGIKLLDYVHLYHRMHSNELLQSFIAYLTLELRFIWVLMVSLQQPLKTKKKLIVLASYFSHKYFDCYIPAMH